MKIGWPTLSPDFGEGWVTSSRHARRLPSCHLSPCPTRYPSTRIPKHLTQIIPGMHSERAPIICLALSVHHRRLASLIGGKRHLTITSHAGTERGTRFPASPIQHRARLLLNQQPHAGQGCRKLLFICQRTSSSASGACFTMPHSCSWNNKTLVRFGTQKRPQ